MHTALVIAAAVAALANWSSRVRPLPMVENISKPLTTLLVLGIAVTSGASTAQIAVAAVALTLCLIGDVALLPSIDKFIIGLGAFLLGHVAFIVLFVMYGLHNPVLAGLALILASLLVITVGRVIVEGATHRDAALRSPVLAYLAIISGMAAVGWATGRWWVVVGTALFVLSDSVLGWGRFVREQRWMALTVMVTYHAAIVSLALSLR